MSCNLVHCSNFNQSFVPSNSTAKVERTIEDKELHAECVLDPLDHKLTFHDI